MEKAAQQLRVQLVHQRHQVRDSPLRSDVEHDRHVAQQRVQVDNRDARLLLALRRHGHRQIGRNGRLADAALAREKGNQLTAIAILEHVLTQRAAFPVGIDNSRDCFSELVLGQRMSDEIPCAGHHGQSQIVFIRQ